VPRGRPGHPSGAGGRLHGDDDRHRDILGLPGAHVGPEHLRGQRAGGAVRDYDGRQRDVLRGDRHYGEGRNGGGERQLYHGETQLCCENGVVSGACTAECGSTVLKL